MTDSMEQPAKGRRQERVGVVTTAKMQKTVVVAVERLVRHGFYKKTIRRTSTFMAHDELGAGRATACASPRAGRCRATSAGR